MSYAEFVEWFAFADVEPLPARRGDLQAAMQMLLLYNIHKGKRGKKLKLSAFVPDWWKERRSPRALEAKMRALTAHMGQEPDLDERHASMRGMEEEKPVRG
jgi:hypothetical protein